MSNIDCDQIILYGLVAMFSIYIYKTMFDNKNNNNLQRFTIGGQNNLNNQNLSNMENSLKNSINQLNQDFNNQMNNQNNRINQVQNQNNSMMNSLSNNIRDTLNNITSNNNNSVPETNVNANSPGYIPAEFKAPEPDNMMGSVPTSYEVGATKSDSCFPQDVLTSDDLLPKEDAEAIKQFTEDESIGDGILKGVNFLSAGYHVGVNSVGQSLRNANLQLRSEPPNPQSQVSPWLNTTIAPDLQRRPLELTESCAKAEGALNPSEVPGQSTNAGTLIN